MTSSDPQELTVSVLVWLAAEPELLSRFLALSGLDAGNLRAAAQEPGFPVGLLNFLMSHEPTLIKFCEDTGTAPESVATAYRKLAGGMDESA